MNTLSTMTRRQAIATTLLSGVAFSLLQNLSVQAETSALIAAKAPFLLPPLGYGFDALEPHIDARTMEIHHGKHHAGYVTNLNKALESAPEVAGKTLEELLTQLDRLPESIRTAVRNNGGGHYNHSLFWKSLKINGGSPAKGLADEIDGTFGSMEGFWTQFTAAATRQFGSGWAWLVVNKAKKLEIVSTPNQDSPISQGLVELLGVDVWEHAYYLQYQNKRADYLVAFRKVVDWDFVSERYATVVS